jgi:uncharacterized protein
VSIGGLGRHRISIDVLSVAGRIIDMRMPSGRVIRIRMHEHSLLPRNRINSQHEERWFTLGTSSEGKLLAVSHTYHQSEESTQAEVRNISTREPTPRERQQYENEPR